MMEKIDWTYRFFAWHLKMVQYCTVKVLEQGKMNAFQFIPELSTVYVRHRSNKSIRWTTLTPWKIKFVWGDINKALDMSMISMIESDDIR